MWIATRGGLARFDGAFFAVFDHTNTPALRNPTIRALAEDADGTLWIGTDGGDLLRYRGGEFRRFGSDDGLATTRITSLVVGQPGELWIGTYGQGVLRFAGGHFAPVSGIPYNIISHLAKADDGSLWIASYGGGVFHLQNGRLETIGRERGLPDLRTWWAEPMGEGAAIATDRGLCLYQQGVCRNLGVQDGLSHRQITSLHAGPKGDLWIGTYGGGLNRLHPDGRIEHLRHDQSGADDIVWDLFEDRSGMLWISTINNGLRLLSDGPFTTLTEEDGLSSRRVTVLEQDDLGNLWVGTRDAGLNCLGPNMAVKAFGRAQGLDADTVWSLAAEGEKVYIGTENGLFLYQNGEIDRVELPGFGPLPAISSLLVTSDAIYIGSSRGLLRKSKEGSSRLFTVDDGLPSNSVRDLLLDHRGHLFVATLQGIAILANDEIRPVTEREGLPSGNVVALYEDAPNQRIFLALGAGGLAALHENGRIDSWSSRQGLHEADLTAITMDDAGYLWLGSARGVLRVSSAALDALLLDPRSSLAQAFYDRLDGVGDGGVWASGHSVAKGRQGRLFFATLSGLTLYNPQRLRAATTPRAQITRLVVDGHELSLQNVGSLPATTREVSFELAAPLPHAGAKVALRYRLQGVDTGWIDARRSRRVSYSGLAPGSYQFEVEASNLQGQFVDQPTRLKFEILPGFFQSWRFFLLLLLAPVLLGFLVYRLRFYQHQKRKKELDRRIEEATAAIDILSGLMPICSSCHKVRDDGGFWEQVETYLSNHSEAEFTHGLCPECCAKVLAEIDDSKHGLLAS